MYVFIFLARKSLGNNSLEIKVPAVQEIASLKYEAVNGSNENMSENPEKPKASNTNCGTAEESVEEIQKVSLICVNILRYLK